MEEKQQIPLSPMAEGEVTTIEVNEHADPAEMERSLESIAGKVNVIDNNILREMPEPWNKSVVLQYFSEEYKDWARKNAVWFAGPANGTKYENQQFLSPDIAAWKMRERPYVLPNEFPAPGVRGHLGHEHFWNNNPAPNWILEFEWKSEVQQARKGIDKIQNFFLYPDYVGSRNTVVEEAWLMAKEQDLDIPLKPRLSWIVRLLRFLAGTYLGWTVGGLIVHLIFELLISLKIGENWTGVLTPRQAPPEDLAMPYIAIFLRDNPNVPLYYHLQWHTVLRAPYGSFFANAEALHINGLLTRMRGVWDEDDGNNKTFLFFKLFA